jgi:hypothetical protein
MPITLNGDNGITNVNGTAAAPAITGTDTDSGMYFATNSVALSTSGVAALTIDASGTIDIPGTSRRITGDFSNATDSNKVIFQTSTVNGGTVINAMPNGTSKYAGFALYNNSDPNNSSLLILNSNVAGTFININSGAIGTGTYLPIQFLTNNSIQARIQTNGNFEFNSGYGSSAVAYGCRAWVNFNGTFTVAIRASGNVSSITDNGTGNYTVNFTTALVDADYCVVAGAAKSDTNNNGDMKAQVNGFNQGASSPNTTTSTTVMTGFCTGATLVDSGVVTVAVFR